MSIFAKLLFGKSSAEERRYLEVTKDLLKNENNPRKRVKIAIKALEHIRDKIRKDSWDDGKKKSTGLNVLYNNVVAATSLKDQVDALSSNKLVGWGTAWDSELRNFFTGLNIGPDDGAVNLQSEKDEKKAKENSLNELMEKNKELKDELTKLNENKKQWEELKQLENRLNIANDKMNKKSKELEIKEVEYQKKVKELETRQDELKKEDPTKLKKSKDELEKLKLEIEAKQKELINKQSTINQASEKLKNEEKEYKQKVAKSLEELENKKKTQEQELEKLKLEIENNGQKKNQEEMKKVEDLKTELNKMKNDISKEKLDLQNQIEKLNYEKSILKVGQEQLKVQKLNFDKQNKEMTQGKNPIPWFSFLGRDYPNPLEKIKQFELLIDSVCTKNYYKKSDGLLSLYSKLKNTRSFYQKYELILAASKSEKLDDDAVSMNYLYNKFNDDFNYLKELKCRAEEVMSRGSIINQEDAETLSTYLNYIDPVENENAYSKCVQILNEVSEKNIIDLNEMPNLKALSSRNKSLANDLVNKKMNIEGLSPETLAGILLQCTNVGNWTYTQNVGVVQEGDSQTVVTYGNDVNCECPGRYILKENSQNDKKYLIISQLENSQITYQPKKADELVYKNDLVSIYAVPEKQKNILANPEYSRSFNKSIMDIIENNKISNKNEYNTILDYFKKHYKSWNEACDTCFKLLKSYINKNNLQNNFLNQIEELDIFTEVLDIGYILYFIYDNKDLITEASIDGNATFKDQKKHIVISYQKDTFPLMENQKLIFTYKNRAVVESPIKYQYSLPNANAAKSGASSAFENFINNQFQAYNYFRKNPNERKFSNEENAKSFISGMYNASLTPNYVDELYKIIKKYNKKDIEKTFFWTKKPDEKTGKPSEIDNLLCLIPIYYQIDDRDKLEKILKILSDFINSKDKSDEAYNAIADGLAELSGQNVSNVNNKGSEKIDGILRDAKSLLKSVRNRHSKGFYFGSICLSNLKQIKDVIKSKNKAIINHFGYPSKIHYPNGDRLNSLDINKFETILEWQKADIYALGICFLEMLFKMDFINCYNQNFNGMLGQQLIDSIINSTKSGNIQNLISTLYHTYAKSEEKKIEKFLFMVHDMLNGKLDVYQSLHELETVSEEQKNIKNTNISIFNVDGNNEIYKEFINNIATLKKKFKDNFNDPTGEFKTKANNLLETIKKFEKELCIYEIRIANKQKSNTKSNDYQFVSSNIKDSNIKEKLEISDTLDKKLYKNFRNQLLSMEIALNKSNSNKTDIFKPIKKFMESILDYINVLLISKDQKDETKTIDDKDMGITKGKASNKKDYSYWKSAKEGNFCLIENGKASLNESEIKQGFVGDCALEAALRSILLGGNFKFENVFPNYTNELKVKIDQDKNGVFYAIKPDIKYITVRLNKVVVNCRIKLEGTEPYAHIYVRPTGKHIDIKMNPTYLIGKTDSKGQTIKGNTKIDTSLWVNFIEKAMTIARVQENLVSIDEKNSKATMFYLNSVIINWKKDPSKLNWQAINGDTENGIYYALLTGQNAGGKLNWNNNDVSKADLLYSYIKEKLDKKEYLSTAFSLLNKQDKDICIGASSTGVEMEYYLNGDTKKMISFNHEYSIEKVYEQNNVKMITLKNPWGDKKSEANYKSQGYDTLDMTIKDFYLRYDGISKGKPSK